MLNVNNLSVEYELQNGSLKAVDSIDFEVKDGEILGIVGESGCGKTTTIKSLLGLLDENGKVSEGEILYNNKNIAEMHEQDLRKEVRWSEMSLIAQSAMAALDPVYKIGSQFSEVIRTHTDMSRKEARNLTKELLKSVDIDPSRIDSYPHQLSGGQRQRVIIALSLVLDPSVIIADEPTTGLDVVVQNQILDLIQEIQEDIDCSVVLVTHDMSVVAEVADRVAVMYGGRIMEIGPTSEVFNRSSHPYTIGLKNAFPTLERNADVNDLVTIPGAPPNLANPPSGCRFKDRCPFATNECETVEPDLHKINNNHAMKCHYPENRDEMREKGDNPEVWSSKSKTIDASARGESND